LEGTPELMSFEGFPPNVGLGETVQRVKVKFPLASSIVMDAVNGAAKHINFLGQEGGPLTGQHGGAFIRAMIRRHGVPTPGGEPRSPLLVSPTLWPAMLNDLTKLAGANFGDDTVKTATGKASGELTSAAAAADYAAYDVLLETLLSPGEDKPATASDEF
jgi:hypothetical protein